VLSSLGAGEKLWLNYSLASPSSAVVHGIVVAAGLYSEAAGSFAVDPAGFVNNSSTQSRTAWYSSNAGGDYRATASIPDDGKTWCLGWWDTAGMATVTWATDVTLTYYH
jgi:hypothetical protein